jgi:hypothetical protein
MHIGKIVSCKIGESKGVISGLSQVKVFDGEGIYKKSIFYLIKMKNSPSLKVVWLHF